MIGLRVGNEKSFVLASGMADEGAVLPMTVNHASEIGSITKTLVACLTLMLREDGQLDLDERLQNWFPNLRHSSEISLKMLLQHTSGIPDYANESYSRDIFERGNRHVWNPEDLLGYALSEPHWFEPGSNSRYSNTNYLLLGMVIEKVGSASLASQIRARILNPLGMSHTHMRDVESPKGLVARGYLWDPHHFLLDQDFSDVTDSVHGSAQFGDGGLVSSANDLMIFSNALFGGKLLSDASLIEMLTPRAVGSPDYGYGVELGSKEIGHSGSFIWGGALLSYYPEFDTTVAALRNVFVLDDVDPTESEILALIDDILSQEVFETEKER